MAYVKQNWENLPSENTPISAARLAHMETQYDEAVSYVDSKASAGVSVLLYGADPTGVESSSSAIQQALSAAHGGEGLVVIPPGTYLVDTVIEIPSGVSISGFGSTIKKSASAPTMVFCTRSNGSQGYGSGGSNISIEGITFQGSFSSGRGIGLGNFHHSDHVTVSRCRFVESLRVGHVADLQGCRYVDFNECIFLGADPSGGLPGWRSNEAIQLDYSTRVGSSVSDQDGSYDGLPSTDISVRNSAFLPLTVSGTTYPAPNPLGSHATVTGRVIERVLFENNLVKSWGPDSENSIRGALHFVATENVEIRNNVFEPGEDSSFAIASWGISRAFPVSSVNDPAAVTEAVAEVGNPNLTVSGNVFSSTATVFSTFCSFRGPSSTSGPSLSGNSFSGTASGQCVVIFDHVGTIISGNLFSDTRRGIYTSGCRGMTVSGNSGVQCSTDVFNIVSGGDVTVTGNTSVDSASVLFSSSPGIVVTGNSSRKTLSGVQVAYDLNNATGITLTSNRHTHSGGGSPVIFRVRGTSSGVAVANSFSGGTTSFVEGVQEAYNFNG